MHLTDRDMCIIQFIEENKGATIEQINQLYFTNYTTCSIRLKKLKDNKYLKCSIHPTLCKKVYYVRKLPSFHALIINDVLIKYKDKIKYSKREFKIKNFIVDCIIILTSGRIIVLEVDIFNKSKKEKLEQVQKILFQQNEKNEIWVMSKRERNKNERIDGVNYILI